MFVDSHHHLWTYTPSQYGWISDEMSILKQDFMVPELRRVASENQIDRFISVQARQNLAETQDLLEIADSESLVGGVVGWVPMADASAAAEIERFAAHPLLKGMRHVVQDEPDDRFLDGEAFNAGIRHLAKHDLLYEILIFPKQLPAAIDFADRHPGIRMVLDHIAKPAIQHGKMDEAWRRDFCELARREHVSCKFSGVATEVRDADWDVETMRPYFEIAMDAFGADRMMFGSDWPVCLLATDYSRWVAAVKELAGSLSESEREGFLGRNAQRVYDLKSDGS